VIALGVGDLPVGWNAARLAGFAVGLGGAGLLAWAAVVLGRFLVHDAAVVEDHALVTGGPYR
jgi:protein-S-isoprenylcysteine O-methyltransferase Ste14